VNGIDRKYDNRTKVLDNRTARNKKDIDGLQQNLLMNTLLGGPKLQKITLLEDGEKDPVEYAVTGLEQDNMMQMMMAMMGGGSFGKDKSMLPLIMMTQQSGDSSGSDNTMLMMMMMMMNK